MIAPHIIQADIVTDIAATAAITALLASASEVREDQYQGASWSYPTVRVAIIDQLPLIGPFPCDLARLAFAVRVYTEGGSSRSNSVILGEINDRYHRRNFIASTWISHLQSAGLANPNRVGQQLWRGEALFEGTVYPTS